MLLLYFPKHQPWDNPFPLGMRIVGSIAYIMPVACFIAIEHIIGTASDIYGIDEAVFTEGIGKIPKGFLVAGGDVVKLINMSNGTALCLVIRQCHV